jgi:hypothetical protein
MFNNTKYTKLYYQIITPTLNRELNTYKELHHIIPRSLGGTDDKDNLTYLTAREHFICHWLLVKMTEGQARSKMIYALQGMRAQNDSQQRYETKITSRVYEHYRIEHARIHSETMKGKPAWNKGRKLEGDELERQRERTRNRKIDPVKQAEGQLKRIAKVTGRKDSEETRLKKSTAHKGKSNGPMSEEEKLKRSVANKGKSKPEGFGDKVAERMREEFSYNNPNRRADLKKVCEHCGIKTGPSNYTRWHGNNCKEKT